MKKSYLFFIKYLIISVLIFISLFLFSVFAIYPQIFRCYWINYSNFKSSQTKVYLSPHIPQALEKSIVNLISQSKNRLQNFWGNLKSQPTLIFCANDEEFQVFGSQGDIPAMVHLTPVGAYIIFKPDGTNLDVISHEMCHAELLARVGWYIKSSQIPAWFDEGLAMRLDYRYPMKGNNNYQNYLKQWKIYTQNGKRAIALKDLTQIQGFFKGNARHTYLAYLTAGMEVARWYEKVGQKGLLDLIEQLRAGENFEKAYQF